MADLIPESSGGALKRMGAGPALLSIGVVAFVLTRVINWLPLGLIDGLINGILWPVAIVGVLAGGFLTWRKMQRDG